MIWFGIGLMSKVAIVFLGAVFHDPGEHHHRRAHAEADFVKVARSFGSNDWQMFLTVVLPSSVPLLLTGLRLGSDTRWSASWSARCTAPPTGSAS
jgi:NitT/TauT family transport system permease protein